MFLSIMQRTWPSLRAPNDVDISGIIAEHLPLLYFIISWQLAGSRDRSYSYNYSYISKASSDAGQVQHSNDTWKAKLDGHLS